MGRVYIANPSTSYVIYEVNGIKRLPVPGTCSDNNYCPSSIFVDRKKHADPGYFGYGKNNVSVCFKDVGPDEKPKHDYIVEIPDCYSIDDDIIIYAFRTRLYVMDTRGFPVTPEGCWIIESSE